MSRFESWELAERAALNDRFRACWRVITYLGLIPSKSIMFNWAVRAREHEVYGGCSNCAALETKNIR